VRLAARLSVFISSFLFLFLVLFLASPKSFAQYSLPTNNPDVPKNLHTLTQNVFLEVIAAFSCQLTGIDPLSPNSKCLGLDTATGKIGYVDNNGGALGGVASLIGATYNIPVHSSDFTGYLASNFGLVKKAYAQSPGYTGLQPLVKVWVIFRNFAYILFVLVFVVIGMAIMFRIKIDPRTVMTIQNQIPKLIIGLVLVTLSFAIAGLLIDLMWIIIYLIISIFSQVIGTNGKPIMDASSVISGLSHSPLQYFHDVGFDLGTIWRASGEIGALVTTIIKDALDAVSSGIPTWLKVVSWLVPPAGALLTIGDPISKAAGGIVQLICFLIIPLVLFFALFRLWFTLLQAFVMVLINVIFAPLWILAGLLPNKQTGFGGWIKSMLANLSVFPVVVLMFVIARIFDGVIAEGGSTQFVPPLTGGTDINSLRALLAIGIILLTPNVVNMTKAAFKSPNMNLGALAKPIRSAAAVPTSAMKDIAAYYMKTPQLGERGGFKGIFRRHGAG